MKSIFFSSPIYTEEDISWLGSLNDFSSPLDLQSIYGTFMQYRLYAEQVLGIFDGIYLAKDEFRAFANILNTSNSHLKEDLKNIEPVLRFCINPNIYCLFRNRKLFCDRIYYCI